MIASIQKLIYETLSGLVSSLVLLGLGALRTRFQAVWDRRHPRLRPLSLLLIALIWVIGNSYVIFTGDTRANIFFLLTSLSMAWIVFRELQQFWRVGLHGADRQVSSGVDYKRALKLCTNEMDFLGTGARKLTQESPGFEEAIRRCQRADRPVRFLLLDPEQGREALSRAARQAGLDTSEYQRRVTESLRVLQHLRTDRGFNIQVRFYPDVREFRLMFIDDSLCLASYNVYGEGDGSQLPQLHLLTRAGRRDVESFFYPMKLYFEHLWSQSRSWDFASYL